MKYTAARANTADSGEIGLTLQTNVSFRLVGISSFRITLFEAGNSDLINRHTIERTQSGATPTSQTPEKVNSRSRAADVTFTYQWGTAPTIATNQALLVQPCLRRSAVTNWQWYAPNPRYPLIVQPGNQLSLRTNQISEDCAKTFRFSEPDFVPPLRRICRRSRRQGYWSNADHITHMLRHATTDLPGRNSQMPFWIGLQALDWPETIYPWNLPLFTAGQQFFQTLNETITFTDTLIRDSIKVLLETITHTDTLIRDTVKAAFTETITFTDTLIKDAIKVLSETITFTDTLDRLFGKVFSETITFTDTLIRDAIKALNETITYTDTLIKDTVKAAFTETITLTDTLEKLATKVFTEVVTFTDTLIRAPTKVLSEVITHTDTLIRDATKVLTETITHIDTLIRQALKSLAETLNLTDTITLLQANIKVLTEIITFVDLPLWLDKFLKRFTSFTDKFTALGTAWQNKHTSPGTSFTEKHSKQNTTYQDKLTKPTTEWQNKY
jgi:hypothetical protein